MLRKIISMPCIRTFCTSRSLLSQGRKSDEAPREHSCNIPPWKPPVQPPPVRFDMLKEFPSNLIRPPCIPGSKPGEFQTCIRGQEGFYCPPCRLKYKYASFSENIDFTPGSAQPPCWWKKSPTCEKNEEDTGTMDSITRRWPCAHENDNPDFWRYNFFVLNRPCFVHCLLTHM